MLSRLHLRVNHATVVAYLALFVALGGSGYAAVTINGKQLKNRSVVGRKLKKDTLTGTEIKESKLGKVPSANTATNASKLGGRPATAYSSSGCPTGTIKVGPTCIDRYEDSVWSKPNGGIQYGLTSADYPCDATGNDCKGKIFARSVAGVTPSRYITWFQAQQALANSGKRLPTSAEWQQAAAGTPDPGASPGAQDCNTASMATVATGSRSNCVSAWGASDMVGNVWEWVADWVPASGPCTSWGSFSDDSMCLSGTNTTVQGPGALIRGGSAVVGAGAGVFAVVGGNPPTSAAAPFGFRGAR